MNDLNELKRKRTKIQKVLNRLKKTYRISIALMSLGLMVILLLNILEKFATTQIVLFSITVGLLLYNILLNRQIESINSRKTSLDFILKYQK